MAIDSNNQVDMERIEPPRQVLLLGVPPTALVRDDPAAGLWGYAKILWEGRILLIAVVAVFTVLAVVYALLATPRYKVDVLLAPAHDENAGSALLGPLGGLAGLAGIAIGRESTSEALAVLESREFTRTFIEERNLLPVLFAEEWDPAKRDWREMDPALRPDIRDAVRFFDEAVRTVREDKATGLVTLTIEWTDSKLAAQWANELASRLNATLRDRALAEAQHNIEYLSGELKQTNVLTLQQAISNLLEREMQQLMLARGNEEFVFRVIDRAVPPKKRSWPMRTLIVLAAMAMGSILASAYILIRHEVRSRLRAAS